MVLHLTNVLDAVELRQAQELLSEEAPWLDGRSSAGNQAIEQKNNRQLAQDSGAAEQLRSLVLSALHRNPLFFAAALPKKIFNPLFNRYEGSQNHYGNHIDGAVLRSKHPEQWVRSDISCTLFLSDPAQYDGGELRIQEFQGERAIKLPAGDAILYPSTSVHQVSPVTRGARLASFFWIESMVRSGEQRRLLFDLDRQLMQLRSTLGEDAPAVIGLTGTYHNLLRMWADV